MLRKGPAPRRSESSNASRSRSAESCPPSWCGVRQGEPGFANRLDLERKVDERPVLVRSRDRTDPERLRRASAEDDPLPPAGADEAPGRVEELAHEACPRAAASRAKAARQLSGSSN